ncbi:hypothetical protein F5Y16DRAFT_422269 [Xylariaceae sp. FL0255]|nr:hypothetical protein F5Y16DRAFT_422269 [Xylariaceae sp. FL0255]
MTSAAGTTSGAVSVPTASTSTTSPASSSTNALSSGASIGISVSAGVVALGAIGLFGFWLLRRRNKSRQPQQPSTAQNWGNEGGRMPEGFYAPSRTTMTSLSKWAQTLPNQATPSELTTGPRTPHYEMAG